MALPKDDRIAFSLNIVTAADKIKAFNMSQAQVQSEIDKLTKLDQANKNLLDPVNSLVNSYHSEFGMLDGQARTAITEQDLLDSANKKVGNYFFPNDQTVTVPSLSATNNVWIKIPPFALTSVIGKNYTETYGTTTKEADLTGPILTLISSTTSYSDIRNTTGQSCGATGTCSLPAYTNSVDCIANSGTWTPGPDLITTDSAIHTIKTNLVNAVNSYKSFLLSQVSAITTNDPDSGNQSLNNAAINNINNVIIPALNTWLAYNDFNTSHGQTTCAGFNAYDSNLLAPTKLHSTQLAALQLAINNRLSFVSTRTSELTTILGSVSQDLSTGDLISSSGLYGKRYGFLLLRLHLLDGSLAKLILMQSGKSSQDAIKNNITNTKNTYMSILPTSLLKAPGNGTTTISVLDSSFLNPGDTVYITAEGQEELQRAVKSVSGDRVVLNDIIPAKFRPAEKARIYKDLT